ncbi:hypothetical protein RM704_42800 [Streptomyces sp. DSM 3412]|uniref:DUF3558 domain-containing protein n=1 Tax=Streptomyces gottesmaniae TaxID=3075518 RepID=A0ABU2ZCH9_9ACTN|nr:hypothetical protein [Streptomyces sp. DSM 3412]MDT0574110.1 hypothetical protein [Streptomyces sp. DSM 3412]
MRTVIRRRSIRGGLLSAAVAGSLILGATGCGGDRDEDGVPDDYKVVAGTQLCGGKAMSAEASKALKVITGSSRFEASAKAYTIAQAATDLVEAFPPASDDICRVYTPRDSPDFDLRITWDLEDSAPTGPSAPEFTELKMGDLAVAAADKAYVFFACRGERFSTSTTVAHIVIGVEHRDPFHEPEDDIEALKDAYATVAHSVSLAMAKELRCEKNGGLPAKPVLNPA